MSETVEPSKSGSDVAPLKKGASPSQEAQELVGLTATDRIIAMFTVVSGAAAVISAGAAFYTAAQINGSSQQTNSAISRMADIGRAMSRQSDVMANELEEMRAQTSDLATQAQSAQGQLKTAQAQTAAISEQTAAIRNSAAAAVQSATAQAKAADAQTRAARLNELAQTPILTIRSLTVSGFEDAADKEGLVKLALSYGFANVGGGTITVRNSFANLFLAPSLPDKPDSASAIPFGGNDYVANPNAPFGNREPIELFYGKQSVDDVKAGRRAILFYGVLNYTDDEGEEKRYCFAEALRLAPKNESAVDFSPVGTSPYCR